MLDNGMESAIQHFPDTYEPADVIQACFVHDDPQQPIVWMEAGDELWNYGYVVTVNTRTHYGSIAVNYPRIKGLAGFNERSFLPLS